ncbi:SAG family member [Eimeria brunetti]|uniref:SAG family member n=1 Tax=Eimeria brunetti TaxID=51314 RepID=U6LNJ6_9EIME|nr:SAG family member [Eimeria brunetti]
MKTFGSVLLAAALLGAARAEDSSGAGTKKGSAVAANCLADFNKVREQAALDPFTAEEVATNKIPTSDTKYIEKGQAVTGVEETSKRTGTYAYAPQTGSTADCSAAVSFWKGAHKNFEELPPAYNKEEEGLYADSKNRSLVALFNPNKGATVDCVYFTCPLTTTTTTTSPTTTPKPTTTPQSPTVSSGQGKASSSERQPAAESSTVENHERESAAASPAAPISNEDGTQKSDPEGPSVRRLSTSEGTVSGLVCLTNPAALVNEKMPFSEDVWNNIKEAIENSAPASTLSALLASATFLLVSFITL